MADEPASAPQRRLWLLQCLLEKMDAEKALDVAARMEAFITTDGQADLRKRDRAAAPSGPTHSSPEVACTVAGCIDHSNSAATSPRATSKRDGAGRLLSEAELQAFVKRASEGATNRDLARLFALTPRQANAIRMALAKRTPQVALRPSGRHDDSAIIATASGPTVPSN